VTGTIRKSGGFIETQHDVRNEADRSKARLFSTVPGRQQPDTGLFHVAGILVHAAPGQAQAVATRLEAVPGALVHAHADGRFALTLEGTRSSDIVEALTTLQRMPGVVAAVLVSEHSEPLDTLDEEIALAP
jgi:nitrate reductase NapD